MHFLGPPLKVFKYSDGAEKFELFGDKLKKKGGCQPN